MAFRGGTVFNKIFLSEPYRYSEDIDLVQTVKAPIGPVVNIIRKKIDPWLGAPKRLFKEGRVTLIYRFETEIKPITKMKLKIEINNSEHFTVFGYQDMDYKVSSGWFSGECKIKTYQVAELLGTKLRALYQRKKGRDLFDLMVAVNEFNNLSADKVVEAFCKYSP